MKRTLSFISTLALAAGLVHATSVESQNIVGYYTLNIAEAGSLQMMAVNLNYIGEEPMTLLEVFGTDQLGQADAVINCDRIVFWDTDLNAYQTVAQWTDGNFYKANTQTEFDSGQMVNPVLEPGSGFWLDARSTGEDREIVVSGEVVTSGSVERTILAGLQMVGFPFSSAIQINDENMDFFDSGATGANAVINCDRIQVWDSENGGYQTYAVWTDGVWYKANTQTEFDQVIEGTKVFALGEGFWYDSRNEFQHTDTQPY